MPRGSPFPFAGYRRHLSVQAPLLLYHLLSGISALSTKPPVTLTLIALNLLIFSIRYFTSLIPPDFVSSANAINRFLSPTRVCLNPAAVLRGEKGRLLLSSFVHTTDLHVLYNMSSFLYKGVTLESALGSEFFLALIVYLSVSAHALYVLLAVVASNLGVTHSLMNRCVVGFSGVIFGLKVIINSDRRYGETAGRIFGVEIPGGGIIWVELVLASALMPNASFIGHLMGILAGLIYVYVPRAISKGLRSGGVRRVNGRFQRFQGRGRRLHED